LRNSKIAELEKQIQELTSVVNPRGQESSNPPNQHAASSEVNSNLGAASTPDPFVDQSHGYQYTGGPPQIGPDHPAINQSISGLNSPFSGTLATSLFKNGIARPGASIPRTISAVELTTAEIDSLFQT
jgi:hypothetical protein